jgi:hypothetical protein
VASHKPPSAAATVVMNQLPVWILAVSALRNQFGGHAVKRVPLSG